MIRIFYSSTNLTSRVARSSAKSWDLRGGWMKYGLSSKETVLDPFMPSHNYSSGRWSEENGKDEGHQESPKGPPKLNLYWNLDDSQRRKLVHPCFVRESVQDTFMQRARGSYHYKKPTKLTAHSRAPQKAKSATTQKAPPTSGPNERKNKLKSTQPGPNPQSQKRKRLIDTAEPALNYIGKPVRARSRAAADLKEAGNLQLELARKKLTSTQTTILQYLMAKHSTKFSGYQIKPKEKERKPSQLSIPQRVKRAEDTKYDKNKENQIRITPRSIEVHHKPSRSLNSFNKLFGQKDHQSEKSKNKLSSEKSAIKSKPVGNPLRKSTSRRDSRREGAMNNIKTVTSFPKQTRSIKRQVSNLELTPQIYPRGSLSMRKSYLPINPCHREASNSSESGYRNPVPGPSIMSQGSKPLINSNYKSERNVSSTLTGKLVDSLKTLFVKIRDIGSK